MNGTIMDLTHGTGNVCRQVVWMLHAQSRLRCKVDMCRYVGKWLC
ncbi:unnamed protein product [Pocillopora meandrina]|uniref:Uncharacterized protein n=1 Tax=Pocillopora meandrina TaxID=46732 RepID=A0AAU9VS12_9CNID|nr:unnamed protein product [Pocillopora meandrina]